MAAHRHEISLQVLKNISRALLSNCFKVTKCCTKTFCLGWVLRSKIAFMRCLTFSNVLYVFVYYFELGHVYREEINLCRSPTLWCSRRPHLSSKLDGFQNRFRLMWNSRALSRLHAGNFWAHSSCFRANRFNKLCRTWLERYWLLRKRQCMRDRKRIGGRQRSLSSLSFISCPLRCPHLIGDIFNLNMFVFEEKEKTRVSGEKPLEAAFKNQI